MSESDLEKSYCQVCDITITSSTIIELQKLWFFHIDTDEHQTNVVKYLMLDIGAKNIDEIPQKIEEFLENQGESDF